MAESSSSKEQGQAATKARISGGSGRNEAERNLTTELSALSKAAEKLRNYDWYLGHDDISQSTKWTKGGGVAWLTADNAEDGSKKKALPVTLAIIGQVSVTNFFAGMRAGYNPAMSYHSEKLLTNGKPSFIVIPPEYAIDELGDIEKDWKTIKANVEALMAKKEVSGPKQKAGFLKEGGIEFTYDLFKSLIENPDKNDEDQRDGCNIDSWLISRRTADIASHDWDFSEAVERLKKRKYYISLPPIYGAAEDTGEQRVPKMKPQEWESKMKGAIVQIFFTVESDCTITGSMQRQDFMPKLVNLQVLREALKPEKVGDDVNAILQGSPKKKKRMTQV